MRALSILATALVLLFPLVNCSKPDPMQEVNDLLAKGQVPQAKLAFEALVDKEQDPNLERDFIKFCFEHKQYRDFSRRAQSYLGRFPDDGEVKHLQFEYYAILAKNAEQQNDYETALTYIVKKLLNVEYADHKRWEKRQTEVLRKWYKEKEKNGDTQGMIEAIKAMQNLDFENLAKDLNEEMFKQLVSTQAAEKPAEKPTDQ